MAKITIEELYYGDKYGICGRATVEFLMARQLKPDQTDIELACVKHTLKVAEEMAANGDTVAW